MRIDFGRLTSVGAAIIMLASLTATPAVAAPSTAGDDTGFANSGLTTVAPVLGRGFFIRPTLRTVYDTNILRIGDGFTPTNGGQREDLRISPLVDASFGLPIGRQQVFVAGSLGRDIYINNEQLNRTRYAVGAGLNLRAASRCTATAAVNFDSRQALVTEVAELVPNLQETLSYGATASCQSPVGLGFGGTVRRLELRNDALTRSQLNYNAMLYSAQLNYALGNIGRFSATGTLNKVGYPTRPVLLVGGGVDTDGVDILSGRFGYQRELGSRLAVILGLSYLESRPQPGTVLQLAPTVPPALPGLVLTPTDRSKFTGLGYDAAITYRPSTRLTATLNAARNVQASANVGAQYQVQTNFGADIEYRLGSALSLGSGVTYDKRRYFDSVFIVNTGGRRIQDDISRVYGNIGYAPVKLYSLGLEVAYQKRKSLPVEFSFDSFSAVLSLRVNFGRES
jgi:hypothetical protein